MTPQKRTPGGNRANGIHSGQLQRNSTTPPAELLLARLDRVKQTGPDSWLACCPAHDDRNPSLSIKLVPDRLLVKCMAHCETGDVMAAVGLSLSDLFDRPLTHNGKPLDHRQRRRYGQAQDALLADALSGRRQSCPGCGEAVSRPGPCPTCAAWHDAIVGIEITRSALMRARP